MINVLSSDKISLLLAHQHNYDLVGDVDRDRLALGVVEPLDRVHHEEHRDAEREDWDEKETHDETGPDRDRKEPDAVVGTTELVVIDPPDLDLEGETGV